MYKREYKINQLGKAAINLACVENIISAEKSLVHEFQFEERVSQQDGTPMFQASDPIYLLFNQQRLNSIGAGAVQLWLQEMNSAASSPLAELRKQCSDDDLLTMVKSRHLQSPSEILAWAQYMTANMSKFESEVAKLVAAKQTEESQSQTATADEGQQMSN